MFKIYLTFLFLFTFFILSCEPSENKKDSLNKKDKPMIVHHLKDEESFDKQTAEIDKYILAYGSVASSLDYSKEDGTYIHVDAHLDSLHKFLKLEEEFSDPTTKESGKRHYYFLKEKIFVTKEVFQNTGSSSAKLTERISYYAPNGICLKTKERSASSEQVLDHIPYNAIPKTVCNVDRALRAINQENEFRLTFQGFVNSEQGDYLVVGEPGKEGYTSALKINKEDSFIQNLKKDELKYVNGTIYLEYEKVRDVSTGFTYQVYKSAAWTKEDLKKKD